MALYRTLGDLRAELRARVGFSAAGAAAGVNQEILNSFLKTAQTVLYWTHDWARLRRYEDKALGVNQYLIDYPVTANPDRIKMISIKDNNIWTPPLQKGIEPQLYTTQDNTSRPWRWEPYEQIELFPKADKAYTVRTFFIKDLDRFTQDGDRATIDDGTIFIYALGDAKEHYKQDGFENYASQRDALLARLKSKSWGKDVFNINSYREEPLARPVVV